MTETARQTRNRQMLGQTHPVFRSRVGAILAALEAAGYRPRIQQAWRSPVEQRQKADTGASHVRWGFHCATRSDGRPDALAVDVLDDDNPLQPSGAYLLRLAALARAQRCQTGILWGLDHAARVAVDRAILAEEWGARVAVGWDPCHVEPADVTIAEAKIGIRPEAA
jgi:hypothetical protein